MTLYHGTDLSSGSNIIASGIDLNRGKPYADFGKGFYTTPDRKHALLCAMRTYKRKFHKLPEANLLSVIKINCDITNPSLNIKAFTSPDENWCRFIINNRIDLEILMQNHTQEHNKLGRYDLCYGEIADGNVVNLAWKINRRIISLTDIDYKVYADKISGIYPIQYSFHTKMALHSIQNIYEEKISSADLEVLYGHQEKKQTYNFY